VVGADLLTGPRLLNREGDQGFDELVVREVREFVGELAPDVDRDQPVEVTLGNLASLRLDLLTDGLLQFLSGAAPPSELRGGRLAGVSA